MSENKTLTSAASAAIADAAGKQSARVVGVTSSKSTKKTATRFDRSKHDYFDPTKVIAYQNRENKDDISACWLAPDGKSAERNQQAEIELPPFLIARGSKIVGEGDAFKDVQNKKGVKISRGSAHFRLVLVKEVSDEMHAIYPDWRAWQDKAVANVRAASIKLITDTFEWKTPPNNWVPFRNNAWKSARNALTIPNRKELTDVEIDELIEASPALKKEERELALKFYIKESRYPFKPSFDEATKLEKAVIASIEAKVYATVDYKEDVYTNENVGPGEIAFPSKATMPEVIHEVIKIMKSQPGKGGKGIDVRLYEPINFVNAMAKREPTEREKKAEKREAKARKAAIEAAKREGRPPPPPPTKKADPIQDRPLITLADGTQAPNYWWNPTTVQNGREVQSYGVAVGGFQLTASELGGYGVKFIMRNKRKLYVIDYEDVPDRDTPDYGKRAHELDRAPEKEVEDDDDDDDDDNDDDNDEEEEQQPGQKRQKKNDAADEGRGEQTPEPTNADAGAGGDDDEDFAL